jgi:hypothetical protein
MLRCRRWLSRHARGSVLKCGIKMLRLVGLAVESWSVRVLLLFVLSAWLAFGATFKLYLKDGDYHMVREYQVLEDRVRYFSTERGDWEEIPIELVDLEKTKREIAKAEQTAKEQSGFEKAEDKAIRAERKELSQIPADAGVYFVESGQIKAVPLADWHVETSNKRKALQMVTPIPIVAGKATVLVKGEHAGFTVESAEPEFYIRLDQREDFGIIKLTPKKGQRIVENISIVPVTKENFEEQKEVETYQREMLPGLFKIWPAKPLGAGEYALVQYTNGELNLRVWDFSCAAVGAPQPAPTTDSKKAKD